MTRVAVYQEDSASSDMPYRAVAVRTQAMGRTAGEALDALTAQLGNEESGTLIIVRDLRADRLFTSEQRQRIEQLMERWRSARDAGTTLSASDQAELEGLIDAEVKAATERAKALHRELAP